MSSIDVIVPCYNYGRFLGECVESVLSQSHRDLRVVILDDASSDDSPEVAAALAAKDSRVELLRHGRNRGHIQTYNEGIELAQADCMLILSADDFLLPGALARAASVFDSRPDVGLAYGLWDTYHAGDRLPEPVTGAAEVVFADAPVLIESLAHGNSICTATAVVRTSVQKALGGYRVDLPHAGDLEMWLRFALSGKIAQIRAPQAMYRRHAGNMSLRYDQEADIRQCVASYRRHYDAIRERIQGGAALEVRVKKILAAKARKRALNALKRARLGAFLRLASLSLAEAR